MFETNPEESMEYPGYYICPLAEWIVVNPNGLAIDTLSGKLIRPTQPTGPRSYPQSNFMSFRTILTHRLLAYVFLKCPGDPEMYQVNHINGIKSDYSLSNLEWVTVSENAVHAYETGLREDNRPIKVKNLKDDTVQRFYSLQQAARFFKVNGGTLHKYLSNRDDLYPFKLKWEVVYDDEEWRGLDKSYIGKIRKGLPKPVVVVDVKSKQVTVYESATHLSEVINVSNALITLWIKQKVNSVASRGLEVYYLHEYKNSLEDDVIYLEHDKSHHRERTVPKRTPLRVTVRDDITQITTEWESVEAFANAVGSSKNTVQKSMLVKNGVWRHYTLTYIK